MNIMINEFANVTGKTLRVIQELQSEVQIGPLIFNDDYS